MRFTRLVAALILPALLTGCLFGGDREPPRKPVRPDPRGPVTLNLPTTRETQQCFADLSKAEVRFSPLPDRDYGGGCQVIGAVQLIDIGLPVTNLKGMRCPLARAFIGWVRNAAVPAAREILDGELVRVETFGSYSCRGVIGGSAASAARVSEHGLGNAVDIAAFVLRDGRRITVERDWRSQDEAAREFLQVVRKSACRRFSTVLSPDYNAAHYNHLHFDMGGRPFCR
ncbi:extensin family protein [Sphingomonas sp. MG17]|uniref:Extensin family protein n=1 Tax=Sphingomonas tagetis TaxID=2949092 RepID=A0A9X2KNC0_9SPHN|nr:extensin family protein [Sphingomonas tagetis]MCP3732627.1 extensin family protein [Sphingomonas tagetis]